MSIYEWSECLNQIIFKCRRPEDPGSLSYEMPATDIRYPLDWPHLQTTVSSHTGLVSIGEQLASRRIAIFGHTARLGEEVPVYQALRALVDLSLGRLPGRDWKRRPGRPNYRWVDQIRNDTGNIPSTLWRSDILRCHGTGVTQRPSPAMRTWWWWWWCFLSQPAPWWCVYWAALSHSLLQVLFAQSHCNVI